MKNAFSKWLLVLSMPFWTAAHATSVLFLNPGLSTESFWVDYTQFMQAAAADLGIELHVLYAQRNPKTTVKQAHEILTGPKRPDYLLFVNEQYIAPEILRLSRGRGVKLFMVNNSLTQDQLKLIKERHDTYPEWIGSMVTNDEEGGYLMLKELIRQRGPLEPGQSIDLLAFSGQSLTPAARLREKGLRRALAEHPEVHLRQLIQGEWSLSRAHEQATQLIKRYPDTSLVWAANDEMALGAMAAFEEAGRKPGKDVLFSAVNSSGPALQARIDGRLSVLVAGHFTVGGWAMVLINDDAHGIDFSNFGGRDRQVPVLQLIDPQQARKLLALDGAHGFGVDFTALSASGRDSSYHYPFSLEPLLK